MRLHNAFKLHFKYERVKSYFFGYAIVFTKTYQYLKFGKIMNFKEQVIYGLIEFEAIIFQFSRDFLKRVEDFRAL